MAKDTFYNLSKDKQDRIYRALKDEFESKPYNEATVKSIVEKLSIARGSFYQYFDDLEEAYFDVLFKETTDIRTLFIALFQDSSYNLTSTLDSYGKQVAEIIFDPNIYMLYKNKYLAWTRDTEVSWRAYRSYADRAYYQALAKDLKAEDMEKIHFIKAVVHSLVIRTFQNDWSKEKFLEIYEKNTKWIIEGVDFYWPSLKVFSIYLIYLLL